MNPYLLDIFDQPVTLKTVLQDYFSPETQREMKRIQALPFKQVIWAGMGSSHYCCLGASLLLNQHGISSQALSASQLLHYQMPMITPDVLLILVSQSGESVEIARILEQLPENQMVVGITNRPESMLSRRAGFKFILGVKEEVSVTTRTYLSSLILAQQLALFLAQTFNSKWMDEVSQAVCAIEQSLAMYDSMEDQLAEFLEIPGSLSLMGRGYSMATVRAGALFLHEVARFPALSFDTGEFRHGPFEMVEEGFHAIVVAPEGTTQDLNIKMAGDIAVRGGKALLISNGTPANLPPGVFHAGFGQVSEYLSPLASIIPIQLIASQLAEKHGIEVGKFRWGSKITLIQ